jgi:hypothetical protein
MDKQGMISARLVQDRVSPGAARVFYISYVRAGGGSPGDGARGSWAPTSQGSPGHERRMGPVPRRQVRRGAGPFASPGEASMKLQDDEITLTAAAHRLGLSYHQALRLVLTGELLGAQRGGHWVVRAAEVVRYRRRRTAGADA